jgi:hypothetical protein
MLRKPEFDAWVEQVLNGLLTITGERTFRVSNLSFGGEAPAVYWRGAKVLAWLNL